eukprot:7576332-Pyramimonas_sp.AAC.1
MGHPRRRRRRYGQRGSPPARERWVAEPMTLKQTASAATCPWHGDGGAIPGGSAIVSTSNS